MGITTGAEAEAYESAKAARVSDNLTMPSKWYADYASRPDIAHLQVEIDPTHFSLALVPMRDNTDSYMEHMALLHQISRKTWTVENRLHDFHHSPLANLVRPSCSSQSDV